MLSAEDFVRIVAQPTPDSHEKRRAARVMVRLPALLIPDDDESQSITVTVADLSPGGAGIISTTPLMRGRMFRLKVTRSGAPPIEIQSEVMHARQLPDLSYFIGARFVGSASAVIPSSDLGA